jgi:Bacterial PH domain
MHGEHENYPSGQDWWLALTLALTGVGFCGAGVVALGALAARHLVFHPAGLAALVPVALGGLVLWQLCATSYEVGAEDLVLRSGPFRWRVPLDAIAEVYPTRNPPAHAPALTWAQHFRSNHPALSLDRLRVDYHRRGGRADFYLISPRDQAGFLRGLARAVPGLRVSGDHAVRGPS